MRQEEWVEEEGLSGWFGLGLVWEEGWLERPSAWMSVDAEVDDEVKCG